MREQAPHLPADGARGPPAGLADGPPQLARADKHPAGWGALTHAAARAMLDAGVAVALATEQGLCIRCLQAGHWANECTN